MKFSNKCITTNENRIESHRHLIRHTLINHFSKRMYDAYHDSCTRSIPRYIVNEQLMLVVVIVVVTYFSTAFIGNNKNQLPFSCSEINERVFTKKHISMENCLLCIRTTYARRNAVHILAKSVYSLTSER